MPKKLIVEAVLNEAIPKENNPNIPYGPDEVAADAAACGGQISIGTRASPDAPAKIEITVSDTGSGMPPAVAQRVTEPLFTTKPHGKGTGLGLSMVQGFVQQSGGELLIDSVDGEGTTIRLVFPRHDEAAPAA